MQKERVSIPPSTRLKVLVRDGHRCVYCGATSQSSELQMDHVIPVCRGGTNDMGNLVTACWACNIGKGKRMVLDVEAGDDGVYVERFDGCTHSLLDVPKDAAEASRQCEDLLAAWLPQFERWWPEVVVAPDAVDLCSRTTNETFGFTPTLVCRGRAGCDIGREVRVLLVRWRAVGCVPPQEQLKIRNAVISGYSVPTMIIMGPPKLFYGVLVNQRHKGTPRGKIIDQFLQPFGEWENTGWYPDENMDFDDLRSPFFNQAHLLTERRWDFGSDQLVVGVYSSCDAWGL